MSRAENEQLKDIDMEVTKTEKLAEAAPTPDVATKPE